MKRDGYNERVSTQGRDVYDYEFTRSTVSVFNFAFYASVGGIQDVVLKRGGVFKRYTILAIYEVMTHTNKIRREDWRWDERRWSLTTTILATI